MEMLVVLKIEQQALIMKRSCGYQGLGEQREEVLVKKQQVSVIQDE